MVRSNLNNLSRDRRSWQIGNNMTKKDYQLIAKAIKLAIDYNRTQSGRMSASEEYRMAHVDYIVEDESVAINLAALLQEDNPRFDRTKFLTACGIQLEQKPVFWSMPQVD